LHIKAKTIYHFKLHSPPPPPDALNKFYEINKISPLQSQSEPKKHAPVQSQQPQLQPPKSKKITKKVPPIEAESPDSIPSAKFSPLHTGFSPVPEDDNYTKKVSYSYIIIINIMKQIYLMF